MSMINKLWTKLNRGDGTTKSGLINMALKPASMLLTILYTPMLLSYLGDEKYGLWVTLLSIINWVNYFDVGIGNGLRNLLAKELAEDELNEVKKSVSTAYITLSIIAGSIMIVSIIFSLLVNWRLIFNTDLDMRGPLLISVMFICINFVLALSNTILYALQLSERVALRGTFIQVLNLLGLIILKSISAGSLVAVAVLYGLTTFIVNIINTYSIMHTREALVPSFTKFTKLKINSICQVGIKFFIINIMALILLTTDNLLITYYFGAARVTPFSIADKIFNTAYTVFAAFLVPYWSRSTVAYLYNDYDWFIQSLRKVCKVGIMFLLGYTVLRISFIPLVTLWLGYTPSFENGIPTIMYVFYIIYSILGIECQFINGSGQINTQLVMYCIAGVANIPFSIFLGVTCKMGTCGIRLASLILISIQVIVLGINMYKLIMEIKEKVVEKKNENQYSS
ncbi:hypothetical protein [uncultured Catenibacterium sp.]|uniref:hypothetical protein n=1 Tax=uncultured Catenibacterium sp. TaxID=286142 RepID=UPI0025947C14|nr:hypothetical protein [uncultured Catenibacterium sp.]